MTNWEHLPANFTDFDEILEVNVERFRKLTKLYEEYGQLQIKFAAKLTGKHIIILLLDIFKGLKI